MPDATVVPLCGAEPVGFAELGAPAGAEPVGAEPPGTMVGTVEGWSAVFQVAVVGQAVVATVGEGTPYGLGPGTSTLVRSAR